MFCGPDNFCHGYQLLPFFESDSHHNGKDEGNQNAKLINWHLKKDICKKNRNSKGCHNHSMGDLRSRLKKKEREREGEGRYEKGRKGKDRISPWCGG